jgi:hypothetical protein
MQENDFEKKMRLKMDELALVPGEEVWKKVALRIGKEKRRKRFLIFLFVFYLSRRYRGHLFLYTKKYHIRSNG